LVKETWWNDFFCYYSIYSCSWVIIGLQLRGFNAFHSSLVIYQMMQKWGALNLAKDLKVLEMFFFWRPIYVVLKKT